MNIAVKGLTKRYINLANEVASEVVIINPSTTDETNNKAKCAAIWDTGASVTAISERAVETLQIPKVGNIVTHTANGERLTTSHYIDLLLPNDVEVKGVFVTKGDFGPNADYDVLIGMDIITLGDFAISNFNGQTMFSFRMPSVSHIDLRNDFLTSPPIRDHEKTPARNSLCPCGSGKKYKHCCGK